MNENTLTTTEAAELLKVSVSRIEQHCRGGRLGQTFGKFGGVWVITRAEIKAFKRLPPGRKKKGTK